MDYKVTVLVAIYKAAEFLKSKLQSLEAQTIFANSQIVLLNCQNLQNEFQIYESFLKHPNVIEILYDEHVSLYKTWNDGIKITHSPYITNANVDDQWHPQYLEKCVHFLDNGAYPIVSSKILITRKPNQVYPNWTHEGEMPFHPYPSSTAGPCPVWSRRLHQSHGYFDERCQTIGDAIMWEKWYAAGEQFGLISEPLVLYYANNASLERRLDEKTGEPLRDSDLRAIGRG